MKTLRKIMVCAFAAVILYSASVDAATHGDANLFFFSGSGDQLEEGTTSYIRIDLNAMNYSASRHMS